MKIPSIRELEKIADKIKKILSPGNAIFLILLAIFSKSLRDEIFILLPVE